MQATKNVVKFTSEIRAPVDDSRLKRIEDKLDALTEATTKLVALETHQQHMIQRVSRLETRMDAFDERLRTAVTSEASASSGSKMFERVGIVILAVAATLIAETFVK